MRTHKPAAAILLYSPTGAWEEEESRGDDKRKRPGPRLGRGEEKKGSEWKDMEDEWKRKGYEEEMQWEKLKRCSEGGVRDERN